MLGTLFLEGGIRIENFEGDEPNNPCIMRTDILASGDIVFRIRKDPFPSLTLIDRHFKEVGERINVLTKFAGAIDGWMKVLPWIKRLLHLGSATALVASAHEAFNDRAQLATLATGPILRASVPMVLSLLPSVVGWLLAGKVRSYFVDRKLGSNLIGRLRDRFDPGGTGKRSQQS